MIWEYLIVPAPLGGIVKSHTQILNDRGREGWELVDVVRPDESMREVYFYFKRQRSSPSGEVDA